MKKIILIITLLVTSFNLFANPPVSQMEKVAIEGVIKKSSFDVNDEEKEIFTIDIQNNEGLYKLTFKCEIEQKCFNMPLTAAKDTVKIEFELNSKDLKRLQTSKFLLSENDFQLTVIKSFKEREMKIEGVVKYLKFYDGYIYLTLKNENKEIKIYIFRDKNLKVVEKLKISKGDYLQLGKPELLSRGKTFIYRDKFSIIEHRAINNFN